MADETSPMDVERENLAVAVVDQPPKTADPQFYEGTMFGLPREWTVEIRPRKASSKYSGKADQFFYEPGTRKQFRSLKAVKKHLGLEMGQTSRKRIPKASKVAGQTENLNNKDKLASKAASQSESVNEKDKAGSSSKAAEEDKDKENDHYFDKVAKRVRWQLINGEQNGWDGYVNVPDVVQKRWMDMFLKPDNYNQESKPPGME